MQQRAVCQKPRLIKSHRTYLPDIFWAQFLQKQTGRHCNADVFQLKPKLVRQELIFFVMRTRGVTSSI